MYARIEPMHLSNIAPRFTSSLSHPLSHVGRESVDADLDEIEVQLSQRRLGGEAIGASGDAVNHNLRKTD